ncbi:hypothetical protein [uncultured Enterovirga sp.]|uniref:hypothetical protein n=1 Tax=uncultured Enterovirga sp. TaxID=2026352 RepID=UPI0035CB813C
MIAASVSQATLGAAAESVIQRALSRGGRATSKPRGEVGAVASVTLDGTPSVAAAWRKLLPRVDLSMVGVFCHGSPMVDVSYSNGTTGRCELADLLLVVDETDRHGAVKDRRANLVQAKLLAGGTLKTSSVQHHLLTGWPSFSFASGAYGSAPRDFSASGLPGRTDESGRYGAIDLLSTPRSWKQNLPATHNTAGDSLGSFLAGMLLGIPGFGRKAIKGAGDDWSSTMDELLTVTALQPLHHSSSLRSGRSRLRGVFAFALVLDDPLNTGAFAVSFDPPPIEEPPGERPARERGISVIRILAHNREG